MKKIKERIVIGMVLGTLLISIMGALTIVNNVANEENEKVIPYVDASEVTFGPDLVISSLTATKTGGQTTVYYKIKNIGNRNLVNTNVYTRIKIWNNGVNSASMSIDDLQTLSLIINAESSQFSVNFASTAFYCVFAIVDYAPLYDYVDETEEDNNKANFNFQHSTIAGGFTISCGIAVINWQTVAGDFYHYFTPIAGWDIVLSETETHLDVNEVGYLNVDITAPDPIVTYPTIRIVTEDFNGEYQYNDIELGP